MSERIKELVQQTDAWCKQNLPANWWTDYVDQYRPLWNAKFAELIVQECAKVAVHKPNGLWYTGTDAGLVSAGRMTAAQLIKEHFGVE